MTYKRINYSEIGDSDGTGTYESGTLVIDSSGNLKLHNGSTTGGVTVPVLNSNGNLTMPGTIWAKASDNGSIIFSNNGTDDNGSIKVDSGYNMVVGVSSNFYVKRAGEDRFAITDTNTTVMAASNIELKSNKSGTEAVWILDTTGNLTLPTNTSVIKYANGTNILDGLSGSSYANANVANYLPTHTGNVSANYFIGNGSLLTDITVSTATTAATVTTNSQPNITSVGTLSGLTVGPNSSIVLSGTSGYLKANSLQGTDGTQTVYLHYGSVAGAAGINTDLTVGAGGTGNLGVAGTISASGNVTGSYFIGNGSQLTDITVSTAATVTTNAQPNITSLGTLSSLSLTGNANITGNLSMQGTILTGSQISGGVISGTGNIRGSNLFTMGIITATGTITGGNLTTGGVTSATGNVTGANLITAGLVTAVGNVIAGNVNTANTISATGNIRSNSSFIATNVSGTISIGNTNSYMMGIGNVNGYVQSYVHNKSNTADASADMIVYGSSGTDNFGYMDMGMTSNNFSSSFFTVTGKSEGYLFMSGIAGTSGNMVLATGPDGSNNSIEFYVGGFNSAKGANRPLLLTKETTTVTGNLSVTGNITGNGAGLTNVTVSAAGNIIGTQSNVTLVAGSYSYVFDNTGTLTLPAAASGDEGGEIDFTQAPNSTLSGTSVTIDQYVDRLRFFESGGSFRGAYIDLTLAAEGVGTLLNNRASGFVNAGVDVTLGNLKARIPTSGNRSIQVSTVTGTYSVYGSAQFTAGGTAGGANIISGFAVSVTTTPAYLQSGNSFNTAGDAGQWIIMDPSAGLAWRISFIIGASFNNNMISIERLV